jgi:putative heme iron utilization protein
MGTLSTHSVSKPGWPFGSVMPYVLDERGAPVFLISAMAVHTQNVVADPRASLLVMQSAGGSDPLGLARATLLGTVTGIDDVPAALRQAYLDRHPNARHWIEYSDFAFYRLDVTHV